MGTDTGAAGAGAGAEVEPGENGGCVGGVGVWIDPGAGADVVVGENGGRPECSLETCAKDCAAGWGI